MRRWSSSHPYSGLVRVVMVLPRGIDRWRFDPYQARLAETLSNTSRVSKHWATGWILSIVGHMCRRMAFLHIRSEDIFLYRIIRIGRQRNASLLVSARHCGCVSACRWTRYMGMTDDRRRLAIVAPHAVLGGRLLAFGACGMMAHVVVAGSRCILKQQALVS